MILLTIRQKAKLMLIIAIFSLFPSIYLSADPVATIPGTRAKKLNAKPGKKSPANVFHHPNEIAEWELPPNLKDGIYRIDATVRTGTNGAAPDGIIYSYKLWTIDAEGKESAKISFKQKPGTKITKTSKKWPVFMGTVSGDSPLFFKAGMKIRMSASKSWANVSKINFLPPQERDFISLNLKTDKKFKLFRKGETINISSQISSFLPNPLPLKLTYKLEGPNGEILSEIKKELTVPLKSTENIEVNFKATMNGPHYVILETSGYKFKYKKEMAVDVVSVAHASRLSDSSAFGIHPAEHKSLCQSGLKWVRLWDTGDTWNTHERQQKGKFDFSHTDEKVNNFLKQGFKVLEVLAYTPTWASTHPEISYYTGNGAPFPPKDIQDWKDYCRKIMTHFKGRINHYEVWNEPNTGNEANLNNGFFRGTTDDYVELLKAAYEVAREVDPNIKIIGGSGTGDFLKWTDAILQRGAAKYMDILSFHAYTTPNSPEDANLEGRLDQLLSMMKKYDADKLPIWNTEVGYWVDVRNGARPTTQQTLLDKAPPNLRPNWQTGWPYRPITENDAAAFVVRHYLLNISKGVEKLFWYAFISNGFPFLRTDGGLCLKALAMANASEQLENHKYLRKVDLGLKNQHIHLWEKDSKVKGFIWFAGSGKQELLCPNDSFTMLDIWGNKIEPIKKNGKVLIEAGRDPVCVTAPESFFAGLELNSIELNIPVKDSFLVNEVDSSRPVKEHTSPKYHGDRKVWGLPDPGDTIGWKLGAIKPGYYFLMVELFTGDKDNLYKNLDSYDLKVKQEKDLEKIKLSPVKDKKLYPKAITTPEGGGRAYGYAISTEPVYLEPGVEIHIANAKGFGFVGDLKLKQAMNYKPVFAMGSLSDNPELDGKLNETTGAKTFKLNRKSQVKFGVSDPFASLGEVDAWKGPKDLSGKFWIMKTPDGIYLAVDVTDGGKLASSRKGAYDGDCIELFLDLREGKHLSTASMSDEVYQIMLRAPEKGNNTKVEHKVPAGTKAIAVKSAKGWIAEFFIPVKLENGRIIGADISLDDDDNGEGRKSQMVWHGTAANHQDPSKYGQFKTP